ncbi:unnamed protein product [Caenorhabditis sp. 36 PRJEB53466]|nr:unnamed protein product [Caenorhabditis sp. 36 PRJEB53466]
MALRLSDVLYVSDFESAYQEGMEMAYTVDGQPRVGEFNRKMGSVAILIFHRELDCFMLVRQFRPAIFTAHVSRLPENVGKDLNEIQWSDYDPEVGHTVELCAGLIDKDGLTLEEIAAEEIAEECGYRVDPDRLLEISTFVVGAHQSGNAQYLFYVEVDESMKISEGGGNAHEGEFISKVFLTVPQAKSIARPAEHTHADVKGPPGVLFALQWWFLVLDPRKKGLIATPPVAYVWRPNNAKHITDVKFSTDFDKKKYGYDPRRMTFTLNGITRTWDMALCPSTTACILVDQVKKQLVLLQTFRPQVLIGKTRNVEDNMDKNMNEIDYSIMDPEEAYTLELPVNQVPNGDDPRKFARIAAKQIGYDLPETEFRLLSQCVPGIGQSGDTQHIYLADVSKARICEKEEDEDVEELRVAFSNLPALYTQEFVGPPTTYYAIGYCLDELI